MPFSVLAVIITMSACSGDNGKLPPKESVAAACHAFTAVADVREAQRTSARGALDSARMALSNGMTAGKLRALSEAEKAVIDAEGQYAQSPDVSLVAIGFAADADAAYQPLLTAFLSGDIAKAKAACSRY